MPITTNQTDTRILDVHIEIAAQAAGHRKCIMIARSGCGFAPITVRTASNLETGRILVITPKSIADMWTETLLDVMSETYPDMPKERVMNFAGRGRVAGAAAFSLAAKYEPDLPLACVITPEQAASAGAWQKAKATSPFGLIVADSAGMYANKKSERSQGLEHCLAKAGAYVLIARTPQELDKLRVKNLPIVNVARMFEDAMAPGEA